tara:strand:+ start:335 stop:565 length:231 start_codon:yes stop_codon:yes gene_type:complete
MINLSDFKDGIPFSFLRKQKPSKKTKKNKKSRSPSRKRKRSRRTKRKPIKIPPRGVIIRKRGKLYKSDGKRLTLIE